MTPTIATEKQAAIAAALRERPGCSDSEFARALGVSRALVRRMRARLGFADAPRDPIEATGRSTPRAVADAPSTPAPGREGRPWPKKLDPFFDEQGFADLLEASLRELLEWEGRLNKLLGHLEVSDRGRFAARDRVRLHHEVLALARRIQFCYVPVGPCPFCGVEHKSAGCHHCSGGGWAPAEKVDIFATMEEKQKRSRWWRRPKVEVPG